MRMRSANCIRKQREDIQMSLNDVNSLTHTKWNCKYHIVFAPKYRRKVIYKTFREDVIEIIKKLCKEMKMELIEGEG